MFHSGGLIFKHIYHVRFVHHNELWDYAPYLLNQPCLISSVSILYTKRALLPFSLHGKGVNTVSIDLKCKLYESYHLKSRFSYHGPCNVLLYLVNKNVLSKLICFRMLSLDLKGGNVFKVLEFRTVLDVF